MDGVMALENMIGSPGMSRRDMLKLTAKAAGTGLAAYLLYDCVAPGKAHGEMRTVNGYTFDYKEDGWEVPRLYKADGTLEDGVKFLGERWADVHPDIPKNETLLRGYKLPNGQIITTYEYNNLLYGINYNSHNGNQGFWLTNISPHFEIEDRFRYLYVRTPSEKTPKIPLFNF